MTAGKTFESDGKTGVTAGKMCATAGRSNKIVTAAGRATGSTGTDTAADTVIGKIVGTTAKGTAIRGNIATIGRNGSVSTGETGKTIPTASAVVVKTGRMNDTQGISGEATNPRGITSMTKDNQKTSFIPSPV